MHRHIAILPYRGSPKWRSFDPKKPCNLPPFPCCYALVHDGLVVYVGQTLNLRARFYAHTLPKGIGAGSLVLKAKFGEKYGDWAMREARLINRLRPKYNIRGV